ncbi:MAG TPA: extracellular solute-binding protein [Acidimicrobiales bacterium]|nr:extracellular solute-binding protein [Acidimicrobiales bacterium]
MSVTSNGRRPTGLVAGPLRTRTRQVLAAIGTTALASTLIAATGPLPGASASANPVTITLGYAGGANINPYYNYVVQHAEEVLPGIKVQQVVYATYDDQLDEMPTQVAAGTIPDIIVWDNSAPVGQYAQQGAIMGLNKLVKAAGVNLSGDPAALLNAWTINGNLYGIPLYLQDSAYVYNLGMLKAAGITTLPTSMQQVGADALTVYKRTGKAGLTILDNLFHLTQYVLAFGGGWGFGKTINSSANIAGMQFLVNLFNEHAAVLPDQVGASWDGVAVGDNEAAMSDGGPWYIGFMSSSAPNVNYALTPIPTSTGKQFVVTYGGAYTITAQSKHPAADMQLIKYLTDSYSEHYVAIDSSFGFVPAMSQYINLYRQLTPRYAAITNSVLANGLTLDYPPSTIQFGNALVSGFENIILRHSGTVRALLNTLQQTYGTK